MLTAALTLAASAVLLGAAVLLFFFHLSVQPVLTGSMRPTFAPGSAVISRTIPVTAVKSGMIVIFVPPGHDASYAHRVLTVSGPAGDRIVTTKGDANPGADPWHARITAPDIQQVIGSVPYLGNVMVAMHGGTLRIVALATAGLFVAITGARAILRSPRRPMAVPARSVS
ncbi:MAG TPA: signal peptidase I [Acidimicrobiales bacterium]|nr:signal peptidase I [Acidimicrobiales bacterium]